MKSKKSAKINSSFPGKSVVMADACTNVPWHVLAGAGYISSPGDLVNVAGIELGNQGEPTGVSE